MIGGTTVYGSIVDDEPDITHLFQDAICENVEGVSVVVFNYPIKAFEHH